MLEFREFNRGCEKMQNNKRIQAAMLADAVNSIEGVPVRLYARELSQQWVNGEITAEQMKNAMLVSHKSLSVLSGKNYG
jgi:hypothetical protein